MIIKNHNRKLINNNNKETLNESCNCRNQDTCPLKGGNCRTESVIYEATVRTKNDSKRYIGLTANQIKKKLLRIVNFILKYFFHSFVTENLKLFKPFYS